MNYHGSMTLLPRRRYRLAAAVSLAFACAAATAQPDPRSPKNPASPNSPAPIIKPSAPPVVTPAAESDAANLDSARPSALTAQLFYEILLGELTTRSGDPGDGFALVLDSARKTRDPALFQRAVEIALQARSGDSALTAVQAWKTALPDSRDAARFELQILIALNRIGETVEPLRTLVSKTPVIERPLLMTAIARSYARAKDKKLAASVVEQALTDEAKGTGVSAAVAWATIGRLRFAADDSAGALDAALKGQQADPLSEGPPALALELMGPAHPLAELIVKRYLRQDKALPEVRMAYARQLLQMRRYTDADAELSRVTAEQPQEPDGWLLLGTLQGYARQDGAARASLERYVELARGQSSEGNADERKRALTQAYLLLSQLAERRKDFAGAQSWLAKIDDGDDLIASRSRRAGLLARQGKVDQGLALLRAIPERKPEDARQKLAAQVQLLREAKQYDAAYKLIAKASAAAPNDADLLYDQAMVAEKMQRYDEMERLLRRVIELKPDNQNAYNALGYSFADRGVKLEEARTLVHKALALAPDDPFITDSLAWVEFKMGNKTEAVRLLQGAYEKRADPEIGAHLGEVLWSLGEHEQAIKVWKEARFSDAANETLRETLQRLRVDL